VPFPLNNVATQDTYVDALTCVFLQPRSSFSVQVFNAAVLYKLLLVPANALRVGTYTADPFEKFYPPALGNFDEGDLPLGQAFAGIMFRSAVAGTPGNVSVA
jgi:hypothetical protein